MPWEEKYNWMRNDNVPLDVYRLMEVYEKALSVDVKVLRKVARELYPERFENEEPGIFVSKGSGKAFDHEGAVVTAKYTIMGSKLNAIGVMEDGTAYVY